jgi:formylglycine-generating enzyme required for sulfatase activity
MPAWGWGLAGFLGLGVMVAIVLLFGRTGQPRSAETSLANEIQTGAATTEPTFMPVDTSTPEASPTPELKMGSTMASEKDGMTLMYVPQGGFEMGSNDGDDDERPVHTVWLDAFWIDQTEVTNAMYAKCVADGLCKSSRCADNIDFIGAGQPVVGVDWNDANSYCEWGGRRLPTEAEWEKAARGMLGRSYPWGEGIDCDKANYGSCKWKTVEVGSYPDGASPYGALDMAGNAWEWVADWYGETYYLSSPDRAPSGPSIGDSRVLRGGSWGNDGVYVRFSCRLWGAPDRWNCYNGFRCAVSPSS